MASSSTGRDGALTSAQGTVVTPAHRSISSIALSCRDLFVVVFNSLENVNDGGLLKVMVRSQAGRFNLWASNAGAVAESYASLDHRLRDLPDIAELIRVHLSQIEDLLKNQTSDEQSSFLERASPDTRIETTLSYVSDSIDWLHRVANTIRRVSTARQKQNAIQLDPDDDEDNATNTGRRKLFHYWIKRDFPMTSDEFCHRLVSTMILRRRAILYRRKRQAELAQLDRKQTPAHIDAAPTTVAASSMTIKRTASAGPTTSVISSVAQPSRPCTQYTATTIDPAIFRQTSTTQSVISQAPTNDLVEGSNDLVPPAPEVPSSASDFVCPFCCMILPAQKARSRHEWAAHIKMDLDPYVCAFFPCEQAETIFGTSTEWLAHMRQVHCMRWRCISKKHKDKVVMFPSRAEYVAHMTAEHGNTITDAQLRLLADTSVRPLKNIFGTCPFCNEFKGTRGKWLEEHIAHHLQHIALMSLPLPDDDKGPTHDDVVLSNAYGNALYDDMSNCEEMSVVSRLTTRTLYHHMPSATFSDEVGISLNNNLERPRDTLIAETNEEKQMELVQRVRMEKLKSANFGLPMTNDEQRHDKILARFVARNDTGGNQGMAPSPSTVAEKSPETVTPLPVAVQEENCVFLVPHERDPNFVGRNTELEYAYDHIFAASVTGASSVSVVGPCGIGKTAFVTELVYRIHDDDPSYICIWVSLSTLERVYEPYLMAAKTLNISFSSLSESQLIFHVHRALSNLKGKRWILVLDDMVDDQLVVSPFWDTFLDSPFPQHFGNGLMISISRGIISSVPAFNSTQWPPFDGALHVKLAPLGSTEALQLLQFNLIDHDLINSRTDTASILSSIGRSPLAIILAAAYINRHMLSLKQYQALLADHAQHVDDLRISKKVRCVARVIFVSLTTICQSDDIATDCLLALACTSGLEIHREHLFVDESQDTNDAIATLEAYGLITTQACNLVIDTVGPLCLVLRLWLSNLGLKEDWVTAAIAVLRRILPEQEYEDGSASTETAALWRRYLPHLAFALQYWSVACRVAATNGMSWNELRDLWIIGLRNYADRDGDSTDTSRHLQRVVELCRVESRHVQLSK